MEIDYTINFPCEPRRRFTRRGLVDRLRLMHETAGGPENRALTPSAAIQAEFELRPLAFHCTRCPVNPAPSAYGCYGSLRLPLTGQAERWLHNRLPRRLRPKRDSTPPERAQMLALAALIERLGARGIDGKVVDERHRRDGLLERKHGLRRSFGLLFKRRRITSGQMLELLLFREAITAEDGELVCRALGIWDSEEDDDGTPVIAFTTPPEPEDDRSTAELKDFLLAMTLACSTDCEVRVNVHEGPPHREADSEPGRS